MKKRIDNLMVMFLIYTMGVFLGLTFCLLRILGRIKILHPEKIPHNQGNLIVVSNHPSLLEPILLPILFFKDYLLHPIKLSPWSVPDKKNYFDKWYWAWAKLKLVPVDRKNKREELKAFFRLKEILDQKGIEIIFAEGGRTCNGKEFVFSKKNSKIRKLGHGVGLLALKTNCKVLIVWVDGAEDVLPNSLIDGQLYWTFPRIWKKVTIKIGDTLTFPQSMREKEITQKISEALLELADKEE